MEYRRLGHSGLKVSKLSIGTWLTTNSIEQNKFQEIIDHALDLGINMFDTANVYNNGQSERLLGSALKGIDRSKIIVSTKVFWPTGEGPNERGLSRKNIIEQCDESLKRLGLDYVDIYYFHRYDSEVSIYESHRAIEDLIRQGKVLYWGVSEWIPDQMQEAIDMADSYHLDRFVVNQVAYNLINRHIEKDILPFCRRNNIGQVAYSPLAQGILTGKYKSMDQLPDVSRAAIYKNKSFYWYFNSHNLSVINKMKKLADDANTTLSNLCLKWVLRDSSISSALIGVSSVEQLIENVKSTQLKIPDDILEQLDEISKETKFEGLQEQ